MTRTVPTSAIVNAYTRPGTAEEIAFCLNFHYRTHISARHVEEVWAKELETNIVLRELGERPRKGFARTDELTLVEKLVMA